jgi:drug/metabolite transporter (DMT)-like permease
VTAVLFGLATALAWSVTSLCSARASRIMGAAPSLALVSLFGLILCIPFAITDSRAAVALGDILWAGLSGLCNVIGLLLVYLAVRRGKVGIVAPIIATDGAVAAVIAVFAGEVLAPVALGLLALIVIGVVLTTLDLNSGDDRYPITGGFLALVIVAAVVIGVSLYSSGRVAGLVPGGWIVASARIVGVAIVTLPLLVSGRLRVAGAALPWIVITAIAEVVGYWLYVFGTRADVAVTAIIASQFAAIAAIGAYLFLGERLSRLQRLGVVVVCVAVGTLAAIQA